MTHTEGPWTIQYSGNDYEGNIICANANRAVAGTITDALSDATSEDEANARLIAAAPDLLAALKALLESIESVDFSSPVQRDGLYDRIPWAQAEDAITKATKEAN